MEKLGLMLRILLVLWVRDLFLYILEDYFQNIIILFFLKEKFESRVNKM